VGGRGGGVGPRPGPPPPPPPLNQLSQMQKKPKRLKSQLNQTSAIGQLTQVWRFGHQNLTHACPRRPLLAP